MAKDTAKVTCQLISIIITTLIIHHPFTISLQARNFILDFKEVGEYGSDS